MCAELSKNKKLSMKPYIAEEIRAVTGEDRPWLFRLKHKEGVYKIRERLTTNGRVRFELGLHGTKLSKNKGREKTGLIKGKNISSSNAVVLLCLYKRSMFEFQQALDAIVDRNPDLGDWLKTRSETISRPTSDDISSLNARFIRVRGVG